MKTVNFRFAELKAESTLDQIEKIREEFLELSTATCCTERIEEAFDLMQATATFIFYATGNKRILRIFNKRHLNKMKKYLQIKRVKGK